MPQRSNTKGRAILPRQLGTLASGLRAYYTLDELSGTTVLDSSGNGNTGAWVGTTSAIHGAAGVIGGCGVLNGTDNYVLIADMANLDAPFPNGLTVAFWIKSPSGTGGASMCVTKNNGTDAQGPFQVRRGGGTSQLSFAVGNGSSSAFVQGTATVFNNVWHPIVCVYDNSTASIYVDDSFDNNGSLTGPAVNNTNTSLMFGSRQRTAQNLLTGALDEIGIWERPLQRNEITMYSTLVRPF